MLLAAAPAREPGDPACWAALPVIAHNTEFKRQQVQRLRAVRLGRVPPEFPEVDHAAAETYRGYAARPDRALALATHAVATAGYLGTPGPARGMASYNLACAQARTNLPDQAAVTLREAIGLNPDVRANAGSDPDLAVLRDSGRLEAALAP
jgi:hypothetical protein